MYVSQVIYQHQLDPFITLEDCPIQKKDIQTSMVQLPVVKQPSIRVRCLSCHGENDLGFSHDDGTDRSLPVQDAGWKN